MINKTYSFDVPNYGDWGRGSHEVEFERKIYRREYIAPRLLTIKIELIGQELKNGKMFVFKFTIDHVLNKQSKKFNEFLLADLNLLQENVGVIDIFPSDATISDYLKTIYVEWEILPPGEREETISRIYSGFKSSSEDLRKKLYSRYDLLTKLNPVSYIRGTNGFSRYFGAKFTDKLVAFENLEYGNAIYVMFEEWEKLSRMSRIDLLSSKINGFTRIVHRKGWEQNLKKTVKNALILSQ